MDPNLKWPAPFYEEEGHTGTQRQEQVMWCQRLCDVSTSQELRATPEARKQPRSILPESHGLDDTLVLHFWPPDLWGRKSVVVLCCSSPRELTDLGLREHRLAHPHLPLVCALCTGTLLLRELSVVSSHRLPALRKHRFSEMTLLTNVL